jgi:hypothetical protein
MKRRLKASGQEFVILHLTLGYSISRDRLTSFENESLCYH